MTKIVVLCDNERDRRRLCRAVGRYGINLHDHSRLPGNAFIISRDALHALQGDCTVVVDSSDAQALDALSHLNLTAITCGTSASDTLSLSSLTADSAAVSLQRTVKTLGGADIEPCEIPVTITAPIGGGCLLLSCALLILLGVDCSRGYFM
jgi:hypothetical protein